MKKTRTASSALFAALAASALLQGCRSQQPGTPSRRTVFGGPTLTGTDVPAAVVRDGTERPARAPAPSASSRALAPGEDVIVPGKPISTTPEPVAAYPAPAPSAGADSYRRFMGGDSAPAAHAPSAPARPVAGSGARGGNGPQSAPQTPAPPAPPAGPSGFREHVVQPGETAGRIANENGMTLAEFKEVNHLPDPNHLQAGVPVLVATGRAPLTGGRSAPREDLHDGARYHVVAAGETLSSIAVRYNTSVGALQQLNRIENPNTIHEGRRLLVAGVPQNPSTPANVTPPPVTPTTRPTVTPTPPMPVATVTPTTRPTVTTTTRPTPPPPPTTPGSTEPGVVEIGGTQVNSRELLAPGGSLLGVVSSGSEPAPAERPASAGPAPTPPSPEAAPGTREYVVKDGEDLYSIGLSLNVKPYEIRLVNGDRNLEGLKPGDRILVPVK